MKHKPMQPSQEVRPMETDYAVSLPNGQMVTATIDANGTVLLDNTSFTERHSLESLVNRARKTNCPHGRARFPISPEESNPCLRKSRRRGSIRTQSSQTVMTY